MATISKGKTWSDNENVTYTDLNGNFDTIYNDYNGGITNDNISSSAAIAESKVSFNTSTGHDHDGTDSKKITINRGFAFFLDGVQIVANEVGPKFIVPQAMTVKKVWFQTDSGTATLRLQHNTTTIVDSLSASSTQDSQDTITSASLTAGEVITLDVTASSSGSGIAVHVECEQ